MGGAFTSLSDDVSTLYWNPSGISRLGAYSFYFNHSEWLADIDYDFVGLSVPISGASAIGLSITYLSMGEMDIRRYGDEETGEIFKAGSYALSATWAMKLTDRFSIGLDAINIAPELGQIETCAILDLFKGYDDILEMMFQLCYDSKRWEKWVPQDYDPINNKNELIRICGHYIFSEDRFSTLLQQFSIESGISKENISNSIQNKITDHLQSLQEV